MFVKKSAWNDIVDKAKRLIRSGQVQVGVNTPQFVTGVVQGDNGVYQPEFSRDDPQAPHALTQSSCTCPWEQYRWQRTRQWKKLEGRMCAHLLALYWKSLATPLDVEDVDYQHAPGQKRTPLPTEMAPPAPSPEAPLPDTDQRSFVPDEVIQPQWETPEMNPTQPGIAPQPISPIQPIAPSRHPRAPQRKLLDIADRIPVDENGNPVQPGAFSVPDGRPPGPTNPGLPGALSHVQHQAMGLNGELPEGLRIVVNQWAPTWAVGRWSQEDYYPRLEAVIDGQVVGRLDIEENSEHYGAWEIANVEVDEHWRRRGIASALLQYARDSYGIVDVDHASEPNRSDDGMAWSEKVGMADRTKVSDFTVEDFRQIPITVEANSFLDFGDGKDEFTQWFNEIIAQGGTASAQLTRDVTLELRGGKIPMPDAQPIGMTAEGIEEYRWQDLGYDPETGERVNANERLHGAPEWRGQFATMVAGKRAIVLAVEPITKMADIMVPLHSSGKLMPHMARGWVNYDDLTPISYEGLRDPFRPQAAIDRFIQDRFGV